MSAGLLFIETWKIWLRLRMFTKLQPFHHDLATWTRLWTAVQKELGIGLDIKTWEQRDEWYDKRPGEISYYLLLLSHPTVRARGHDVRVGNKVALTILFESSNGLNLSPA